MKNIKDKIVLEQMFGYYEIKITNTWICKIISISKYQQQNGSFWAYIFLSWINILIFTIINNNYYRAKNTFISSIIANLLNYKHKTKNSYFFVDKKFNIFIYHAHINTHPYIYTTIFIVCSLIKIRLLIKYWLVK